MLIASIATVQLLRKICPQLGWLSLERVHSSNDMPASKLKKAAIQKALTLLKSAAFAKKSVPSTLFYPSNSLIGLSGPCAGSQIRKTGCTFTATFFILKVIVTLFPACLPVTMGENNHGEDIACPLASVIPSSILKNLTPVKKNHNSAGDAKQVEKRNNLIETRRLKLQERSNLVLQRVRQVEVRRQLRSLVLKESVKRNEKLVRRRRHEVVEAKRKNAQRFQKYYGMVAQRQRRLLFSKRNDGSNFLEINNNSFQNDGSNSLEINNNSFQNDDKETGSLLQPSQANDRNTVVDNNTKGHRARKTDMAASSLYDLQYYSDKLRQICTIQRCVRRSMLAKHIIDLKKTGTLQKLWTLNSTEVKKQLLPKHDSYKAITGVLKLMGLPGKYNIFTYGYILLAEFKETTSRLGKHPGYNTNQLVFDDKEAGELENSIANMMSVILYKSAFSLLVSFNQMFHTMDEFPIDPYSLPRLKFAKLWRQFCFYFGVFRPMHLKRTNSSIFHAISILRAEIEYAAILNNDEDGLASTLMEQRDYLIDKRQKLNSLKKSELVDIKNIFYGSPWVRVREIERDQVYERLLSVVFDSRNSFYYSGAQLRLMASQKVLAQLRRTDLNLPCHYEPSRPTPVVSIGGTKYIFPPFLQVNQWRKYLLAIYLKVYSTESTSVPLKLKTGRFPQLGMQQRPLDSYMNIDLLFESMNMVTTKRKVKKIIQNLQGDEARNAYITLDRNLTEMSLHMIEYCIHFENLLSTRPYDTALSHIRELDFVELLSGDDCRVGLHTMINFFKTIFQAILELCELKPATFGHFRQNTLHLFHQLSSFTDDTQFNHDFVIEISLYYQGTYTVLCDMWLRKSMETLNHEIVSFECGMVLASSYSGNHVYKTSMGTSQPNLRFPEFFKHLSLFDDTLYTSLGTCFIPMYHASTHIPQNIEFKPNMGRNRSFDYFYKVFVTFLGWNIRAPIPQKMHSSHIINELTTLFVDEIKELLQDYRSLVYSRVVTVLLETMFVNTSMRGLGGEILLYFEDLNSQGTLIMANHFMKTFGSSFKNYSTHQRKSFENMLSRQLSNGYVLNVLQQKLETILLSNETLQDVIYNNFMYLHHETSGFSIRVKQFFRSYYQVYHPILDWIYEDIGNGQ